MGVGVERQPLLGLAACQVLEEGTKLLLALCTINGAHATATVYILPVVLAGAYRSMCNKPAAQAQCAYALELLHTRVKGRLRTDVCQSSLPCRSTCTIPSR